MTAPEPVTGRQRQFGPQRHSKPPARAWDEALARVPAFAARVQPLYAALDWRWVHGDLANLRVPDVDRIAATLADLIERVRRTVEQLPDGEWLGRWSRSGGLGVTCELDLVGCVAITLAFSVEDEIDAEVRP